MKNKEGAYQFLRQLQECLDENAPSPNTIKSLVDSVWKKPKDQKAEREKLESKENIPFYYFAAPQIFRLGKQIANMTDQQMRESFFRCVYYAKFPELSLSNVRRTRGHPFSKKWEITPADLFKVWQNAPTKTQANEAWPEAGLASPFPFKILFEAKYFEADSLNEAKSQLVRGIYETVFYRGLPVCEGWDYEFGCLVAYDVSSKALLKTAWESVESKGLFWNEANVFVIIVRSSASQVDS